MPILFLLLSFAFLWWVRMLWPVKGLSFVDPMVLKDVSDVQINLKMLDVRDAVEYQKCHMDGSINISLGRLPFVWKKELSPDEPVLILADADYKSKRAARVLKRQGFREIYAVRGEYCA